MRAEILTTLSRRLARHPLAFQALNAVGRPVLVEPVLSAMARSASRRALAENGGRRFLEVEVEIDAGGFRMMLDLAASRDALLLSQLRRQGSYEPATGAFLADKLRPGDTFVDGGANDGYFTLMGSSLVGRSGQVVAFEPSFAPWVRLLRNLRLNLAANVEVHSEALWSRATELPLYESRREDGFDSLVRLPHFRQRKAFSLVRSTTLDVAVPGGARVVKLDLEGSEGEALAGAERLLSSGLIRYLVLEWAPSLARTPADLERRFRSYFHAGEVYELLPSARRPGYTLEGPARSRRELSAMPENLVVVP